VPWPADETELLMQLAVEGKTDVEIAEAIAQAFPGRYVRTPHSVYYRSLEVGAPVVYTMRPQSTRPGMRHRYRPGNNDDGLTWAGAVKVDAAFRKAMAREGRQPQVPTGEPCTDAPVRADVNPYNGYRHSD